MMCHARCDGRCEYAIQSGAEGEGFCSPVCVMEPRYQVILTERQRDFLIGHLQACLWGDKECLAQTSNSDAKAVLKDSIERFESVLKFLRGAKLYSSEQVEKMREALELIASTDSIDAALDPQRAIRVARSVLPSSKEKP